MRLTAADQWLALFRAHTPLGGNYLCGEKAPDVEVTVSVIAADGTKTEASIDGPRYLYPHEVLGKTADIREFLADQAVRVAKGLDVSKVPPKFSNLNGIWGEWKGSDILQGKTPLRPQLDDAQKELMATLEPKVHTFMCYSTALWDD